MVQVVSEYGSSLLYPLKYNFLSQDCSMVICILVFIYSHENFSTEQAPVSHGLPMIFHALKVQFFVRKMCHGYMYTRLHI